MALIIYFPALTPLAVPLYRAVGQQKDVLSQPLTAGMAARLGAGGNLGGAGAPYATSLPNMHFGQGMPMSMHPPPPHGGPPPPQTLPSGGAFPMDASGTSGSNRVGGGRVSAPYDSQMQGLYQNAYNQHPQMQVPMFNDWGSGGNIMPMMGMMFNVGSNGGVPGFPADYNPISRVRIPACPSSMSSAVPEFLFQLTKMLTDNNKDIISWNEGKIEVHNPTKLSTNVLHRYFRHSKYASFQRQLNYFGFRKIAGKGKMSPCSYVNPNVTSSISSLLKIKRKTNASSSGGSAKRPNPGSSSSGGADSNFLDPSYQGNKKAPPGRHGATRSSARRLVTLDADKGGDQDKDSVGNSSHNIGGSVNSADQKGADVTVLDIRSQSKPGGLDCGGNAYDNALSAAEATGRPAGIGVVSNSSSNESICKSFGQALGVAGMGVKHYYNNYGGAKGEFDDTDLIFNQSYSVPCSDPYTAAPPPVSDVNYNSVNAHPVVASDINGNFSGNMPEKTSFDELSQNFRNSVQSQNQSVPALVQNHYYAKNLPASPSHLNSNLGEEKKSEQEPYTSGYRDRTEGEGAPKQNQLDSVQQEN